MNPYLIIIILALVGEFLVRSVVRYLNLKSMSPNLPSEFDGFYQSQEYQKSQRYTQAKTKLAYATSSVSLLAIIGLIFIEGFGIVASISLLLTQLMPLFFAPVNEHGITDLVLKFYISIFCVLFIMVENDTPIPFIKKSTILQNYFSRGFVYSFIRQHCFFHYQGLR